MEGDKDIKILETQIQACKECKFVTCEQCEISYTEVKAIENLIARYKELEGEVEAQLEILKDYKQENEKYKKYYETEKIIWSRKDYIPKSKIKEKIGIKMQKNNNIIHNYKKKYGKDFYWYDEVQQANAENYIYKGILQELLED